MIRVANGQGFWGDWLEAPARLVEQGPIDYLTLDYLAEVTMAVLEKQRQRNPELGYAADFPPLMERLAPEMRQRSIRVVTNAGGLNPRACAREVLRRAPGLKIAIVEGDDVTARIGEFLAKGHPLNNIDTGEPIGQIRDRILSANAYLGAFPLAQALTAGAGVVISGRCADSALVLAPSIHAFGWSADAWDLLAAGATAGHVVECGAQTTGGNSQVDWREIPDLDEIGYPIAEIDAGGTFAITKHAGTGGRVTTEIVKEQLLYEIGDPRSYLTPDVIADFTGLDLADEGPDRVRITGARGRERPPRLKLSINYRAGWKATGRWSTPRRTRFKRRRRPTASCGAGSKSSACVSTKSIPNILAGTRAMAGLRRRHATSRRCSCGSACAGACGATWTALRGRWLRWCSAARQAPPAMAAKGARRSAK